MAPAGIALVFLAPAWAFKLVIVLIMLTGTWEFHRLAGLRIAPGVTLLAVQMLIMGSMFLFWPFVSGQATIFLSLGCLSWCLMFLRLTRYRAEQTPGFSFQTVSSVSALAGITFCTYSLVLLRDQTHGVFLILLLLIIIWAADIGAYFCGRQFGRTELASIISPKKTREGVLGGMVLAALTALLLLRYIPGPELAPGPALILVAVTVLASVGGDLFISIHKRTVKMKDAGRIFPGHGGVLDRFDSLLAGAPFFTLGVWMLRA